ncbi:unnamed protein product, partial [Amoebophrya sp. A120]
RHYYIEKWRQEKVAKIKRLCRNPNLKRVGRKHIHLMRTAVKLHKFNETRFNTENQEEIAKTITIREVLDPDVCYEPDDWRTP